MSQPINQDSQTVTATTTTVSTGVNVKQCVGFCLMNVITVTTPSAGTFTAAASDICTKVAHGMLTGLKVQVSNSGGALPGGLAAATDYYVIKLSADTFSLASSLVNAVAGTAINITDAGTGTQTVTPTAIAGASFKLQGSLDDSTYVDLGVSNNITASANFIYEKVDPMYNYIRCSYTMTAGQISSVQSTSVKG